MGTTYKNGHYYGGAVGNFYIEEDSTEVDDIPTVDADMLGGKYTASDIDTINNNLNDLEEKVGDGLAWKFLSETTGAVSVTLPSSFNELYIIFENMMPVVVPYVRLTETAKEYRTGYYITSSNNAGFGANVSKTTAILETAYYGNTNKKSTAVMQIYYR